MLSFLVLDFFFCSLPFRPRQMFRFGCVQSQRLFVKLPYLGLSDSTFSTITIVTEAIVTIFDSFTIVCLPILGLLIQSPNCLAHKHYDR